MQLPIAIIHTIIPYVRPQDLPSLFINNNLNLTQKIKYDGFNHPTTTTNIIKLIKYFPSIIISGINLNTLPQLHPQKQNQNHIIFKHTQKIKLNQHILQKWICTNPITHLELNYDNALNLDLIEFPKLMHIKITGYGKFSIQNIIECINLKSFHVRSNNALNIYITNFNDFNTKIKIIITNECTGWEKISKLVNLRKIVVDTHNSHDVNLEECFNLRCIHINGSFRDIRMIINKKRNKLRNIKLRSNVNLDELATKTLRKLNVFHSEGEFHGYNYKNLRTLCMKCASNNVDFLSGIVKLRELSLVFCHMLTSLRDLYLHKNIKVLHLDECSKLCDGKELRKMSSLRRFQLYKWGDKFDVTDLPDNLVELRLVGVEFNKCEFSSLNLKLLKSIELEKCEGLYSLAGLERCVNLRRVVVKNCRNLTDVDILWGMEIKELDLDFNFYQVKPHVSMNKLRKLRISVFNSDINSHITYIDFNGCVSLETLEINGLSKLVGIIGLQNSRLDNLLIKSCKSMKDLSGLKSCPHLEEITFVRCFELENLEVLRSCSGLNVVNFYGRPRQLVNNPYFRISDNCIQCVYLVKEYLSSDYH